MSDCSDPEWLCSIVDDAKLYRPYGTQYRDLYQGDFVFFVPSPGYPDSLSTLYDRCSQLLCHPDGGISGRGDGRCRDFVEQPLDNVVAIPFESFNDCQDRTTD